MRANLRQQRRYRRTVIHRKQTVSYAVKRVKNIYLVRITGVVCAQMKMTKKAILPRTPLSTRS